MCGAKAERHVFLFKRALLVAKKRDDVTMSVKAFIEVTLLPPINGLILIMKLELYSAYAKLEK